MITEPHHSGNRRIAEARILPNRQVARRIRATRRDSVTASAPGHGPGRRKLLRATDRYLARRKSEYIRVGRSGLGDSDAGGCLAAWSALTCRPDYYPTSGIHRTVTVQVAQPPPGRDRAGGPRPSNTY